MIRCPRSHRGHLACKKPSRKPLVRLATAETSSKRGETKSVCKSCAALARPMLQPRESDQRLTSPSCSSRMVVQRVLVSSDEVQVDSPVSTTSLTLPAWWRAATDGRVLFDHLYDIVTFHSSLDARSFVQNYRFADAARFPRRVDVADDAFLTDDTLPPRTPARHLGASTAATAARAARAAPRDVDVFFLDVVAAEDAGTIAQDPEEPDEEEEAGDTAQDDADDGAGCWAGIEALVDGGNGDDAAATGLSRAEEGGVWSWRAFEQSSGGSREELRGFAEYLSGVEMAGVCCDGRCALREMWEHRHGA